MNSFEIALRTKQLPEKIEELVPMMFAGQAAVKFMSAKLKMVSDKNINDPLGILEEQRKKTVEDGQCMGELLLRVMGRIGELSEKIPTAEKGSRSASEKSAHRSTKHKELGLNNYRQLQQAQFIKNHPDIVEKTIAECKKNDDIPNISTVMATHKLNQYMKKNPPQERDNPDINNATLSLINKMSDCWIKLHAIVKHSKHLTQDNKDRLVELIDKIYEEKEKII